jgi:hypothetical protein
MLSIMLMQQTSKALIRNALRGIETAKDKQLQVQSNRYNTTVIGTRDLSQRCTEKLFLYCRYCCCCSPEIVECEIRLHIFLSFSNIPPLWQQLR